MRPLGLVGNVALDRIDGGPPRLGGGVFHGARALHALGRNAHVLASCAFADAAPLRRELAALETPVTVLLAPATASFSFAYDGDRRAMRLETLGSSWRGEDVQGLMDEVHWVHVSPLARSDFSAQALAELARGRTLSLDGQGLVRAARTGPLLLDGDFDPDLLTHVSILKLAEEEARVISPRLEFGHLHVPEVVVTLGSRGSLVWTPNAIEAIVAEPVRGHIDPTGAGDAFAAAYLAARSVGDSPAAAARRASSLVAELLSARAR